MTLSYEGGTLTVDVPATRAFHARLPRIADECPCAYCQNYVRAIEQAPPEALALLDALGIDPQRIFEVVTYDGRPYEHQLLTEGNTLIAGRLLPEGDDIPYEAGDMKVHFSNRPSSFAHYADFPLPEETVTVTYWINLPWLGEE